MVGQQCARRPLPLLPALGKLVIASAVAAATMALLGYAGGGELGNFGHVGVDQATFGPAVFLWFVGIGGLTVAMAGGIARSAETASPTARTHVRAGRVRAGLTKTSISTTTVEPEPEARARARPSTPSPSPNPSRNPPSNPRTKSRSTRSLPTIEPAPIIRALPPDFDDDLPDPEDLDYIDDDDATPGPIGDQRRPADD